MGPDATIFVFWKVNMKVTQSCPALRNPMDYTVRGILQARIREWVAFPFSRGSSQPRDQTQASLIAGRFFTSWAAREAQRACCFPIRELNPGLSHDRQGYSTTLLRGWQSCSVVSNCLWPRELYSPWNSPDQNLGVGSLSHLQGIFPTQGSNPGLLHYRRILYQLSHKESPRRLGWVAYPFSRRSSLHRNQTGVSCITGGFFTSWATSWAVGNSAAVNTEGHISIGDVFLSIE